MNENQDLVSITPTGLNGVVCKMGLRVKWQGCGGRAWGQNVKPGTWLVPTAGARARLSRAFCLGVSMLTTLYKSSRDLPYYPPWCSEDITEKCDYGSPKLKSQSSSSLLEKPDPIRRTETTQTLRSGRLDLNPDSASRWRSSWASGLPSRSRKTGVKIYVREAPHFMSPVVGPYYDYCYCYYWELRDTGNPPDSPWLCNNERCFYVLQRKKQFAISSPTWVDCSFLLINIYEAGFVPLRGKGLFVEQRSINLYGNYPPFCSSAPRSKDNWNKGPMSLMGRIH